MDKHWFWYGHWTRRLYARSFGYFSWRTWGWSLRLFRNFNLRCYCPRGVTLDCSLCLFGCTLWLQFSSDNLRSPCICERVVWSVLPGSYADEIEEYGEEKLRAEFPYLWETCGDSPRKKCCQGVEP